VKIIFDLTQKVLLDVSISYYYILYPKIKSGHFKDKPNQKNDLQRNVSTTQVYFFFYIPNVFSVKPKKIYPCNTSLIIGISFP